MRNFSFPIFPKTLSLLTVTLLLLVNSGIQAQVLEKNNPVPTPQNVPPTQNAPTLPKKLNWRESGNKKGVTFGEYQAAFYKDWQGRKPKKGEGFKPFKRWEDMMAPRVYPSGDMTLPATTYNNFMEWEKNQAVQDSRARTSTTLSTTGNWTELGPLSKPAGYDAGVGRIDFVRFDPTNPSIMYVCSPDGGLWKSVNGGTSWTTNTDFLPIIGCADLVIDPTNTQIMYLATGNREFDRNSIGILKSTDGGTTWSPTALTIPTQNGWTIRRLIMDPTNPQVMIAVLNVGVFRTTDGWATRTVPGSIANKNLEDAEFKPGDPNTVYAAGKEFYKSTDKGVTWTKITSGLPAEASVSRALIAVTAANPDYVYAVYGNADGGYLGTYRSTDSGTSFTAQSTLASLNNNILNCDTLTTTTSGQASHNLAIVVSPTNADSVSIGGCNVWQSGDGGTTWTLSSFWLGNDPAFPGINPATPSYVHADIQSLDYRPGSSSVLFVTSDGGISKSTTGGNRKWTDISNNLSVAQMTNVGQSSLTPLNMIAGLQDIGTLKNSNGSWFVTNGGDGEDGFIDRTNDNTIITSNPNGQFALSTDAGVTKADITGLPPGTEFFSPIHQDPTDATLVYAGGRTALYKSNTVLTDPAAAWTALGTPVGTGGITRFEIAPSNNQVIYALKFNALSKSTDGGSSFTNITGVLPISQALPTNLCVSNTDPNKVWVTFSGYTAGEKVYRTTDGGTTWINISAGLPNIPMNTIVYTNNSPTDAVYVGADIGVYYMDNTTAWQQFKTGLPNSIVRDMEIYYPTSKIRAATYGRGLWESDLYTAVVCVKPDAGKDSTYACVNNQLPTALDLKDAQAGQKWKVGTIPAGSSVAVLTPSGNVSGTFVAGAYQFILQTQSDSLNCRDTVVVTLQACACVKPDAGKDSTYACIAGNLPTGFDLKDALAGQKWKIISPVPPGASISIASPSGMVSGTIVAGTYNFALQTQSDSIACRDTVKITVTPCTKPNAGPDQTLACSGTAQPTGADLVDAKVGEKWKILTIPPGANIKVTTPAGLVTPNSPTTSLPAGLYQFVLQNQSDSLTCRDTVNVTVPNCTPVCVQPTRLVTATNPTCTTMGKVELTSTSGDKYGISNGGTYTGPAYATATAVPGSLPAIRLDN